MFWPTRNAVYCAENTGVGQSVEGFTQASTETAPAPTAGTSSEASIGSTELVTDTATEAATTEPPLSATDAETMFTTTEFGTDATETFIDTAEPATTGDEATASLVTTAEEVPTETGPNIFLPPMSVCAASPITYCMVRVLCVFVVARVLHWLLSRRGSIARHNSCPKMTQLSYYTICIDSSLFLYAD
jgi:hypothetical protein